MVCQGSSNPCAMLGRRRMGDCGRLNARLADNTVLAEDVDGRCSTAAARFGVARSLLPGRAFTTMRDHPMTFLRKFAVSVAAAVSLLCGGAAVAQQPFPSMPIKLVVPFAAGGTADVVGRLFAERIGADLGQPALVDNRSGAGGGIGAQAVARAKADGHTILSISTAHVIAPSLTKNLPYDLDKEFIPVFGVAAVPEVLAVNAKSPIRSVADIAAAAKGPKGVSYSSGGAGSLSHLTSARLANELKVSATHVPYRGLSETIQAVVGDHVQFTFVNIPDVIELAKAGNVRLLAVTSERRQPSLPDVPTMVELGYPGFVAYSWTGYVVPAGTPPDVLTRLQNAFVQAAADPALQERLAKLGVAIRSRVGSDYGQFLHEEGARWKKVIEDNKIKIEN